MRQPREGLRLFASIGACVGGSRMFLLIPVLMDALRRGSRGWSEQQIGLLGSGDVAGMFMGGVLALCLPPLAPWHASRTGRTASALVAVG